jgi:AcrR family transcriptional regulator
MARPREYDPHAVVAAAKEVFWQRGYESSDLDELERATGLSRSSIYVAFGSKRGLFEEATEEYRATFIESLLGPVEAPGAVADDAAAFFAELASLFRGRLGSRGCLLINAIGELAGRDPAVSRAGAEFHQRYRRAFANALGGSPAPRARHRAQTSHRSEILAACAMGVWITSRVDPDAAADACDAIVEQIRSWGTLDAPRVQRRR